MKKFLGASLLLTLWVALPERMAVAEEASASAAELQLADKEKKAGEKLAKKLLSEATEATKKYKMHGLAVGMFRQVLAWDPDNQKARDALLYEKLDGVWRRAADKTIEVQQREDEFENPDAHRAANSRIKKDAERFCKDAAKEFTKVAEEGESLASAARKEAADLKLKAAEAAALVAKQDPNADPAKEPEFLAKAAAKEAEAAVLDKEALRIWRQVLLYDIDNADVRKKLGFALLESGLWVPQTVADQLTYTEPVKPYEDKEFVERCGKAALKFELKGAATAHGSMMFPATADATKVQAMADVGERALRVFKELFLLGDNFNAPHHFHYVVPDKDSYQAIVSVSIPSEDDKKMIKEHIACRSCTVPRPSGVTYIASGGDVDSTSYIYAHQITEDTTGANFGDLATWIQETIANTIEEITTLSTNLSCVANRTDSDRPTVMKEGTEKKRRKACTDMVLEGLDRPLERAIAAVGSNEIEGSGIMKCSGVLNMLYMLDAKAFIEFLHNSVGQKGEEQKKIFQTAFDRTIPEWDNWWKYLVLGTYLVK